MLLSVFTLQLLGMAWHQHDLGDTSHDCVSCYLAAQLPSGGIVSPVMVLVALAVVLFHIAPLATKSFIAIDGYLAPPAHAPPRVLRLITTSSSTRRVAPASAGRAPCPRSAIRTPLAIDV